MDVHNGFAGVTAGQSREAYPSGPLGSPGDWLPFPRATDARLEIGGAAGEGWQRAAQEGELRIGQSLLRWRVEHDREYGPYRVEVGLARGLLRPPLRMRLEIDRWSASSSRTALEL